MPQYSADERKSRTTLSWNMYLDLEKEIIDFLNYVPLTESHLGIFSPKLAKIILQAGPEILNAFNLSIGNLEPRAKMDEMFGEGGLSTEIAALWTEEAELRKNHKSLTFNKYYAFLEKHGYYKLSRAEVQLTEKPSFVFNPFNEEIPNWWKIYNGLKHDKYDNMSRATLFETLTCLSGLF
jgi:hypothetical protein